MADPTDPPEPKGDPEPDPKDALGDSGKTALTAERKARRDADRRATDAEARLKELEDKDKTEVDRLRADNARLTTENGTLTTAKLKFEVASSRGLTAAQAKRLVGNTVEELEADADEILEAFPAGNGGGASGGATPPPTRRPAENLRGGTLPTDEPEEMDPAKLAAELPRL